MATIKVAKKPPLRKFWCLSKNTNIKGEIEGIIYPSGKCIVGVDVWRFLIKNDFPSYEYKSYNSFTEVKRDFIIIPIRKGYFVKPSKSQESLKPLDDPWY